VPARRLLVLTLISGIQAIGLLAYAIFDIIGWIRFGLTGPSEVSNVPAIVLQIIILGCLGAGLLAVAFAWFRAKRWARAPFVTMQAIALVVGWPLASATGSVERAVGIALVIMAIVGVVTALSPKVTRLLEPSA
jgi:hypothetical protein